MLKKLIPPLAGVFALVFIEKIFFPPPKPGIPPGTIGLEPEGRYRYTFVFRDQAPPILPPTLLSDATVERPDSHTIVVTGTYFGPFLGVRSRMEVLGPNGSYVMTITAA